MIAKSITELMSAEQVAYVKSVAIASSINAIVLTDLSGRPIYANPAFLRMWRCKENDVLGQPAAEFWQQPEEAAAIISSVQENEGWSGEITAKRCDGSLFEARISASLIRDQAGRPLCVMGFFLDVTPYRQTEQQLRKYASELDERVKELDLLYKFSALAEDLELTETSYLHNVVRMLPDGWQYSDDTCAQIRVGSQIFSTQNYRETAWQQQSPIVVDGQTLGAVVVGYLSQHPARDEGPFLAEERSLINEIARLIARIIARNQSALALQESEERFRSTFEQAAVGLAQVAPNGRFLRVNQKLCTIVGYSAAELLMLTFQEITHPHDLDADLAFVSQMLAGERASYSMEKRYLRRDGSVVWANLTVALTHDAAGLPKYFISAVEDISQRKKAEEALSQSEARFRDLFENSPISLFEQDFSAVKRRIAALDPSEILDYRAFFETHPEIVAECISLVQNLAANQASLKLYGATNKTELLTGLDRLVPPEFHQFFIDELVWLAQGRTSFVLEGINRKLSGELIHIRLHWSAAPGCEDTLRRVLVSIEDITARKQAEAALLASEERYRSVSELTSDFAFAFRLNPDGSLHADWITDAFTRITGFTMDEVDFPDGWLTLIQPDDRAEAQRAVAELMAGTPIVVELRVLTKGGETRWLRFHSRPRLDPQSHRVVGFQGAGQDITEYKRIEQDMLRTERLAAMGQIAATLAHEIKNPLQAVQNNLELLSDFPLDPDERDKTLQLCQSELRQLIDITQNVLSLSRTDPTTYQPVSITKVWQVTLDLLNQQILEAGIEVQTDFPLDLPRTNGSFEQLSQVMLNLTLNALENMPTGGHLAIVGRQRGQRLEVTVTNDGKPILEQYLDRLFEPFFTTKAEGTGLGLFVCHTILHQHGGTLAAANLPDGSGVSFTITLPLVAEEIQA